MRSDSGMQKIVGTFGKALSDPNTTLYVWGNAAMLEVGGKKPFAAEYDLIRNDGWRRTR